MVHWHQRDVRSDAIAPGDLTPRDRDVALAIAAARRRGLEVMLFPIVWVERRAPGAWRGTLVPRDRDAWWSSYERFILHYAAIAEAGGAGWLSIGSELGSTETWRGRWYHLISRVRRAYSGSLTYSANWDHFRLVSFWRRLEAIGINGYFPLTSDRAATENEMARAWEKRAAALSRFAAAAGKPLFLTEVGYPSRDGGAVEPWQYTGRAPIDLEEQRRAYAAFARAWGRGEKLAGVVFWTWNGAGGAADRGYTPRGKPAERVLRRFFRRLRPGAAEGG